MAPSFRGEQDRSEEERRGEERRQDRTGQEESKPKDDCNGQHWLDYDTFGNSQVCTTGWMLLV